MLNPGEEALVKIGRRLRELAYRFVTITPDSHRRVWERDPERRAQDLRDVFGWNLPFRLDTLDKPLAGWLTEADALAPEADGYFRSRWRVSSLGEDLYFHSSFPTSEQSAVFFGPDTYRFVNFLQAELPAAAGHLLDIGCGSGAGGWALRGRCTRITLHDVNDSALVIARVNTVLNGGASVTPVDFVRGDIYQGLTGNYDTIVANPPFIIDESERAYRHGGDGYGTQLTLKIAAEAVAHLEPRGRFLLYSGAPQVAGRDVLREGLNALLRDSGHSMTYREIDPDIFGEELSHRAYREVERLAAVSAVIGR